MRAESPERHTLSTGHEVTVPLETAAEATAVTATADAGRAGEWLPGGLAPVRVAPGRTAVTFLAVDYRRIGDDAMAPYEEFGVLLAATPAPDAAVPELAAVRRGLTDAESTVGGYVADLPVTTEPARALGGEVWGYPKRVATVDVTDRGDRRRTALGDDRGRVLTIDAPFRPRFRWTVETASFTAERGLRRQPLGLSGAFGVRPLGGSYALGHHPLAERLRDLGLGRPLAALAFDGAFVVGTGRRIGPGGGRGVPPGRG